MSPAFILLLTIQALIAVAVGTVVGGYLLEKLKRESESDVPLGAPERALAALVGLCLLAVALMVGHIVTGGAVFGSRAPVPVTAAVILWFGRRRLLARPRRLPAPAVLWLIAGLALLYVLPVLTGGFGARLGDPSWHLGWTEQVLAGDPVPTGPAAGVAANAYPWGFHALLAMLVRLVPGSEPLIALETVHLMIVAGIPLAAVCLARRVAPGAGPAAAAAVSLIGGFGWLAGSPGLETTPYEATNADLVVTSPNSVFELLPPALPREVGLMLLGATAVLVLLALKTPDRRSAIATGIVLGTVGLFSVPMFVGALAWSLGAWVSASRARNFLLWMAGTGGLIFALWAGPVGAAFTRYGGFVDITPRLGREWPLPEALGAWGLLLPAAILGAVVAARGRALASTSLLAFAGTCIALLALALARSNFGWSLWGHDTVLHQGRVWPQDHLLGGALAGIAWTVAGAASTALRTTLAALVLTLGAPSVVRGSIDMHAVLAANRDGFHYDSANLDPDAFVRVAAAHLGPDDVVAVPPVHDSLGFLLFQFSGARLSDYDDLRLASNDLRIRYRDLASEWEETRSRSGFGADFQVAPASSVPDGEVLAQGLYDGRRWALTRAVGES